MSKSKEAVADVEQKIVNRVTEAVTNRSTHRFCSSIADLFRSIPDDIFPAYSGDCETVITDPTGYISKTQQIRNFLTAGHRLDEWRDTLYDYPDGVYEHDIDQVEGHDYSYDRTRELAEVAQRYDEELKRYKQIVAAYNNFHNEQEAKIVQTKKENEASQTQGKQSSVSPDVQTSQTKAPSQETLVNNSTDVK